MKRFLLDTGIVLGYARGAGYAQYVDKKFDLSNPLNTPLISVVTKGEIYSLAIQNNWGSSKLTTLENLLRRVPTVDINDEQIIKRYADIDAYSLNRHSNRRLPQEQVGRRMGKNDLWISATASVLKAVLLTTDHDFEHLAGTFLDLIYIDTKLTLIDLQ
ncbi:MAG TPA: PIN domain-containing protein [Pyrinomonadaceae bacterium]